jgi:inhibitor of cysteine peptidase
MVKNRGVVLMEEKKFLGKISKRTKIIISGALLICFAAGAAALFNERHRSNPVLGSGSTLKELPTVGTVEQLEKLIKRHEPKWYYGDEMVRGLGRNSMLKEAAADSAASSIGSSGRDYSVTNIQVEGVDEADIVKSDGSYIYKVFHRWDSIEDKGVHIIKAYPEEDLRLVAKISLKEINPTMLFLKDDYLVVIGYKEIDNKTEPQSNKKIAVDSYWPWYQQRTAALIYDISDRSKPKLIRELEVDGTMSSARMIQNRVYIVSNKYVYSNVLREGGEKINEEVYLPAYKDSVVGKDTKVVGLEEVRYCPQAIEPNYIIISSFNLNNVEEKLKVTSILGSGGSIYSSTENLYVSGYNYSNNEAKTVFYKFNLEDGSANFTASGEVRGNILNQFSMDEHNGYFRVTTTSQRMKNRVSVGVNGRTLIAPSEFEETMNNVYVFDKNMKVVGKIEDLAKGERIYSTRFMGDRAYMVTFKTTDPLFVLDLKNPRSPKVLGELKIPGFSNYLHPYDENHIIGFGMDADAVEMHGTEVAITQGMKIAVFDVSDVNNPKEKFVTSIGDRGTYSDILQDHKALLFSKAKNLLAFPITLREFTKENDKTKPDALWQYGELTFMGAYVYNIDMEAGFTLKGRISHIPPETKLHYEYDEWQSRIWRILYIEDKLYTVSDNHIKINDINSLKSKGAIKLK